MRAHAVEGSNVSIYGACFQDRVSHETDSAGQTHSTRQHEPQTSPLLRVEVRFCRPPLPAGHPDHRTWVPGSCQSKGDALEPSRTQKTSSHVQALCKGKRERWQPPMPMGRGCGLRSRCTAVRLPGNWTAGLYQNSLPHHVPLLWNQHLGNQAQQTIDERRQLSQFNARFRDRRAPRPWAQKGAHQFGSWASNLSIAPTFLGPNLALFGGSVAKHKQGLLNIWQQGYICCTRASELAAAHFRDTVYTYTYTVLYTYLHCAYHLVLWMGPLNTCKLGCIPK